MTALYELLQTKQSRSSGTGCSYYGSYATCGMKGRLQEMFPYEEQELEGTELTPTGRRKVNARRAGTFFHALQEMWRLDAIPADMIVAADHADYDFELALNSCAQYRAQWNNNRHNLGTVHSAEVRLPSTPEQTARVMEFTGGHPFSMRYDLLTDIDQATVNRIAVERGVALPGAGRYIIDYKLVGSITAQTMWQYSYDFQQIAYPVIYNLCYPEAPVRGMLTEVMARVLKPLPRHYALYLAYADINAADIVRHGIQFAERARVTGAANPVGGCIGKYGPCWFLVNNLCPRYGHFDAFDFTEGTARRKDSHA
jgi:hypothetical protein